MFNIEILKPEDWRLFKSVRLMSLQTDPTAFLHSFTEEEKYSDEEWENKISSELFTMYVDKKDSNIAAFAGVKRESSDRFEHSAIVGPFYTLPPFRRQGMGGALLSKILEDLRSDNSTKKALLYVNETQKEAISLYQKIGFQKAGLLKKETYIDGKYYDQFIMEILFEEKL